MHIAFNIRDNAVSRHNGRVQGWRVRQVLNAVNGSTLLGVLLGLASRSRFRPGPDGLVLAGDSRLPLRGASALTVGDVVLSHEDTRWLLAHPRLLRHEGRHSWQYAACLGLPMLPLYAVAAAWSYLRGGDFGVHNPFERLAGLEDGGYPLLSARERRRRTAA
jgi:hypothetical protein